MLSFTWAPSLIVLVLQTMNAASPNSPDGNHKNLDTFTNLKIPKHLVKQLQNIANVDEFLKKVSGRGRRLAVRSINPKLLQPRPEKIRNFTTQVEIGPIFDKRAFCQPRRIPVHVPQPVDPTLIFQPMCIQIERCGGCCAHELFECVPSVKRNATRKVVALRYPHAGAEYFEFEKVANVKIERHARCKCQCKIQPEDCTVHQVYNKESCRCTCPRKDGHLKCKAPQVWHEKDCRCKCSDLDECSTGTYFDPRTCRCRSVAEIITYARMYKNPWIKSYVPERPSTNL